MLSLLIDWGQLFRIDMKTVLLKGQTLIELLLAMSLTGILLPVLIVSFTSSRDGQAQESQRIGAVQLIREGQEAARSVRERGFDELETNGTFHPENSSGQWNLIPGEETVNGYTRRIIISDVYRDLAGAIIGIGGTIDPSTKRIDVEVSWETPRQSTLTTTLFMSRYENDVVIETTEETFLEGDPDGTVITNTTDGEVILGAGGIGNWCAPEFLEDGLDLPGQGIAQAITAIEGKVFAGTGENASGYSSLEIDITNDYPPAVTLGGTFNGFKTNDIFGEEDYIYISTDTNNREVVILDITGTHTEVGYFDAPGNSNGESIYVLGNIGYVTVGNKLYNFNLSSKTGERPIIDSDGVTLLHSANSVFVVGNYAYVALNGTTELQIVDVSNPNNLTVVGSANTNSQVARDVFVNPTGTRAYMATAESVSQDELFIINVETKAGNRPIVGSYNSNGMDPQGVTVVTGNKAVLVGTGGEEYQVIDITDETNLARCGGINTDIPINDVASVLEADSDAYSYIVTDDSNLEFRIIPGGPGGSFSTEGMYTSHAMDATDNVVFNRIIPDVILPPNTEALFQVGIADAVNGNCTDPTYTFVGPDGTSGTYFDETGGPIPFDNDGLGFENPARCFKYRIYMSTEDFTATPIVNSVIINYSL